MGFECELVVQLPWIRKMARRFYRHEADIEDLASETTLRLWQMRDRYDEGQSFRSLAYKVMQNIYINQYNKRQCVTFFDILPSDGVTETSADSLVRARQVIQTVRRASMRSVCIRSVAMSALGYSCKEIAEHLNIPVGTVQRRIHEGRKILKKAIGK